MSPQITRLRAKAHRRTETYSEKALWSMLRNKKFEQLKFKRQFPIHPYIVDFYCNELKLIIELDGVSHESKSKIKYDKARDDFLRKSGFQVIRISDDDFISEPNLLFNVISRIKKKKQLEHPRNPSPKSSPDS